MTDRPPNESPTCAVKDVRGLGALETLQANASGFFQKTLDAHGSNMVCRAGCSACCHVTLEVFPSEAGRILQWALGLSPDARLVLKAHLLRAKEQGGTFGLDAAGKKRSPCVFLSDGLCGVYEARPILCRTQGSPLQLKKDDGKGNVTLEVDACPLNFQTPGSLPPPAEWLDLERLAVLQVLAERQFAAADNEGLFGPRPKKERVALSEVRKLLLDLLG
ncbi:MAG: YkgJ family cysteine cluster protein [Silvanigrellales bacterium]|nr:YkgJ family cysteine cluster protein [Silvanigrellales bacterium]